jgi:hypothetical protein
MLKTKSALDELMKTKKLWCFPDKVLKLNGLAPGNASSGPSNEIIIRLASV